MGAIEKIERYTEGLSWDDFRDNDMAVDAVIRNFEVIGQISADIVEKA